MMMLPCWVFWTNTERIKTMAFAYRVYFENDFITFDNFRVANICADLVNDYYEAIDYQYLSTRALNESYANGIRHECIKVFHIDPKDSGRVEYVKPIN